MAKAASTTNAEAKKESMVLCMVWYEERIKE